MVSGLRLSDKLQSHIDHEGTGIESPQIQQTHRSERPKPHATTCFKPELAQDRSASEVVDSGQGSSLQQTTKHSNNRQRMEEGAAVASHAARIVAEDQRCKQVVIWQRSRYGKTPEHDMTCAHGQYLRTV